MKPLDQRATMEPRMRSTASMCKAQAGDHAEEARHQPGLATGWCEITFGPCSPSRPVRVFMLASMPAFTRRLTLASMLGALLRGLACAPPATRASRPKPVPLPAPMERSHCRFGRNGRWYKGTGASVRLARQVAAVGAHGGAASPVPSSGWFDARLSSPRGAPDDGR